MRKGNDSGVEETVELANLSLCHMAGDTSGGGRDGRKQRTDPTLIVTVVYNVVLEVSWPVTTDCSI
jgi:hypothetical protein